MPLSEEQVWRRRTRDALERDGTLLEGASGSQSRRGSARGGVRPSSETETRPSGRLALERGGTSPEGATGPRARRGCTGAAPCPSSRAEFRPRVAGPIFWWAVSLFLRVCLDLFAFGFYELKRVSPGCLEDPHGCHRHHVATNYNTIQSSNSFTSQAQTKNFHHRH
jgi:hypothetical protein